MLVVSLLVKSNVVYDASPLVRGELAVAYARLVRGAGGVLNEAVSLMQDTILQQQKKHSELLRLQQLHQQQQRQAAAEEAAAAAAGALPRSTSGSSMPAAGDAASSSGSDDAAAPSNPRPAGISSSTQQQQQQATNGSWGSSSAGHGSAGRSWKGEGGLAGSDNSPGSKLAGWAELDGVDGSPAVGSLSDSTALLYALLEQVLLLATDPSIKVCGNATACCVSAT
jgi:hypothetical protein